MNKFKEIIGGTEEEAYKKFPWLKKAIFVDAYIDIRESCLVWKSGTWKGGIWEDGIWKDGIWKNGTWKNGFWEGGYWEIGIWEGGCWEDGTWEDGIWEDGRWEKGTWKDGVWKDGRECGFRCKWKVCIKEDHIEISCMKKTIEEWDKFFESNKEYDTKRGTEAFRLIERAYAGARAIMMFDKKKR